MVYIWSFAVFGKIDNFFLKTCFIRQRDCSGYHELHMYWFIPRSSGLSDDLSWTFLSRTGKPSWPDSSGKRRAGLIIPTSRSGGLNSWHFGFQNFFLFPYGRVQWNAQIDIKCIRKIRFKVDERKGNGTLLKILQVF